MATSLSCGNWSTDLLKQKWNSVFTEKYYRLHNDDLDVQCIYLLLEGATEKLQQLTSRYANASLMYKEKLTELEEKNKEISNLKNKILKKTECEKCSKLEIELAQTSKKADEAQKRMNSIAKILCLGNLESNDCEKRNTALGIVSQMLLDSSPKRKRARTEELPFKENILVPASFHSSTDNNYTEMKQKDNSENDVGSIVPNTVIHSPLRLISNLVKSSVKKKVSDNKKTPPLRCSKSVNLPREISPKIVAAKRNLSADDCALISNDDTEEDLIDKRKLSFNIDLNNIEIKKDNELNILDATLVEYVKDGRRELENIWFTDYNKGVTAAAFDQEKGKTDIQTSEKTPSREKNAKQDKKIADYWLLKEKRELNKSLKSTDSKKFRQTKLELGVKQQSVDISTLPGFNGGTPKNIDKEDDIIPASPGTIDSDRTLLHVSTTQESCVFKPIASSTQRPINEISSSSSGNKSPTYVYKRGAVKKRSERAKLPGWDCDECKKYYSSLSKDLSPNKIKERMNVCSRHRDKFKLKLNETPADFWNPLFPDTQECREKGMYVSIHYPADKVT